MKFRNFIAKRYSALQEKKKNGKSGGFDGMVVTICLILLVMILIFLFNTVIVNKVKTSINTVGEEVESLTNWAGDQQSNTTTNTDTNNGTNP